MFKKKIASVFLIGTLVLTAGCAKVPKLSNGQEKFASIDGYEISVDDLYKELKSKGGLSIMLDMIDRNIINKEIKDQTGAETYAEGQISTYQEYYGDDFEKTLKQYGYESIDSFKESIKIDYLKQKVALNYLKTTVKDKEISDYYEKNIYGDLTVRYILIKPAELDSNASDADKLKAEEEAKKKAQDIIDRINKGEKFEDLAKEYSDDDATSEKGGKLGSFNDRSNYDKNFLESAIELKVNEYSKTPVKSQYGYHIIYKTKQNDKPELDKVKDAVIAKIANEKVTNDSTFASKAMISLRQKYEMKITDSKLSSKYDSIYNK